MISEVITMGRKKIDPGATFRPAVVVQRLPKIRAREILCGTIQKIADKKEDRLLRTIDDLSSLLGIYQGLQSIGYSFARRD